LASNNHQSMKQDPCFKYLAAVILSGVLLALAEATASDGASAPTSALTAGIAAPVAAKS
jgi:hypothetical protein